MSSVGPLNPSVDVSIIVVNWNTANLLRACLTSLQQAAQPASREVIVVDNASRDGSAEMVARDFPEVQLLVNNRNRGFAAANNQGLRVAHGRYVLLLNSDTVVPPGAIETMVQYMDAHPRVGIVGPRLLNGDGSLQSSMRDFPHLAYDALAILETYRWPLVGHLADAFLSRTRLYGSDHRETRRVDWLMGACLLLRREALEQVGALDEGYFFFTEELDLCYRLSRRGWQIVLLADATIVHLGGQSTARVPAARIVWHYSGMLRFYRLHRGPMQQGVLRTAIALAALAHLVVLLLRHQTLARRRSLLAAYATVLARALGR